jgi:predicted transcriptional regulator
MPDKFFYKGIPSLNGTIVPDDVFDILMPLCSGAEFKVLAYIVRRTFGFKKESDTISLKQMIDGITKRDGEVLDHGTGLSKATAAVAIKGLVEKGIIEAHRNRSKEKGDEPTTYRLRFEEKYPVSKNQTGGCIKNGQGGVQKSDTQQTVLQTTDLQFRNSNSKLDKYESKDNKGYRDFKTMGDLLKNKMAKKKLDIHQVPESLKITIDEISREFGEKRNFRSNLTHLLRIIQESGKNPEGFTSYLYEARSITKQQGSVKKKMPYFFRVLEDVIGTKKSANF